MLKKVLSILLGAFMLLPIVSFADTNEYASQNLKEALASEGIEANLGDYKESDDKITIYLFRGNGCGYCNNFLKFLNDNINEYGKYFNLVSYEVFGNQNNASLLTEVSTFMGGAVTTVPYIVIGEEVFSGFSEQSNGDAIKKAIKDLYESKDRYDVFEAMGKTHEQPKDNTPTIIVWNLVFTAVATAVILYVVDRKVKLLNTKIDELEKNLQKRK